jgi:hypothetical protein
MVAGWIQRHQQQVISYLQEENRVLKAHLGGRGLRLIDTERRPLAMLAHPLGRKRLKDVVTIATPDTLLCWYKRLIAQKFDGSRHRQKLGRPRVAEEIEQLVVRMAKENATWGYRRIQGALANLGHDIDAITVRNILRRHYMEPAPQRRKAGMSWAQFLKLHLGGPRGYGLLQGGGGDVARLRHVLLSGIVRFYIPNGLGLHPVVGSCSLTSSIQGDKSSQLLLSSMATSFIRLLPRPGYTGPTNAIKGAMIIIISLLCLPCIARVWCPLLRQVLERKVAVVAHDHWTQDH